ncbi:MAG: YARHG domain-containing protein [Pseudomonadota bacterium]
MSIRHTIGGVLAAGMIAIPAPAFATSCVDLWYERNLIFAQAGYCFMTSLGKRTFAQYECWTDNPQLTAADQRIVAAIKREERRRGCKVN